MKIAITELTSTGMKETLYRMPEVDEELETITFHWRSIDRIQVWRQNGDVAIYTKVVEPEVNGNQ